MSRLAIIEPKTLMGEAVREIVASEPGRWDAIELFTTDPEEVGAVAEIAGRAAIVQSPEDDALGAFDIVLVCDREIGPEILGAVTDSARVIFIDPETPIEDAIPGVAGINDEQTASANRVASPTAGVLMLANLLAPLRSLERIEISAHVLQPASARGKAGFDELFAQTRAILSMGDERPEELFGTQLAFNLLPWAGTSATLGPQLEALLGSTIQARVHLSQAGVFHCCSAGIFLAAAPDPGATQLQDLMLENPLVEMAEHPDLLGPVAAAATDRILIGEPTPSSAGAYWLWSCADNLTLSANNALALARN